MKTQYDVASSLLNIVNNKDQFKKELSDKIKSLEIGESIQILVSGKIKKIIKISNSEASIIE